MENPFWLALTAPQPAYLLRIGAFAAAFAGLFVAVDRLVSAAASGSALQVVSSPRGGAKHGAKTSARSGLSAATNVCSAVHALVTAVGAVWTVWQLWMGDPSGLAPMVWQWVLAFSQGYFIADAGLYGTRREAWVLIHHGWMIVAHHPIGEPLVGCRLMGAGDCSLAIWLSATGYWAEISTIFLVIRWFQIRFLRKHSVWYTINSVCLLVTYPLMRIPTALAILVFSLWPRSAEYERQGLSSLVTFTTVTYIVMALMSSFYFYTLVSRGLLRALVFAPAGSSKEQ
mmetsp:Transcript_10827/g.27992  ORF Transcript_10827/g.27992 Transcript_10827/m.27992 type:complete len:285 (-) Transcript_10827:80-934(-)